MQVAGVKGHLQPCQKQPSKESREHTHRQEEAWATGNPAFAIGAQTAAWNNTMQMRMV